MGTNHSSIYLVAKGELMVESLNHKSVTQEVKLLILGNLLIAVGDSVLLVVLAIWAKVLTGSNVIAGLMFVALLLPSLLAPVAGPTIDSRPARNILLTSNLVTIACLLPLVFLGSKPPLILLFVVALVYGALAVVYQGCRTTVVAQVVPADRVVRVNALLRTSRSMLSLVGPVIGAGVFYAFGGPAVLLLAISTLLASAICLYLMPVRQPAGKRSALSVKKFVVGVDYVLQSPCLRVFIAGILVSLLFVGIFSVTELPALDFVGRPAEYLGVLTGVEGVGAVVGGLSAVRLCDQIGEFRLVAIGCSLQAAAGLLVCLGLSIPLYLAVLLYGAGLPMTLIGMDTAFMARTPSDLQGRVSTAVEALTGVPLVLSFALASGLLAIVDFRLLAAVMAAGTLISVPFYIGARARDTPLTGEVDGAAASV